jgi:HEAT repeat protein
MLSGHPQIAILGQSGSGRTCLLAYLAQRHASKDTEAETECPAERLPLYLNLADRAWQPPQRPDTRSEEGAPPEERAPEEPEAPDEAASPLDRLVRSALATVNEPARFAPVLRQHLEVGTALVLADGWHDLPPELQREAATWLGGLADEFPGNFWIVAAGPNGFAPLVEAGFSPVRLGPWTPKQTRSLVERWTEALETAEASQPPDLRPLLAALNNALQRGAGPFELTLMCWVFLTQGSLPRERVDVFEQGVDQLLAPPEEGPGWSPAAVRGALSRMAFTLREEDRSVLAAEEIAEILNTVLLPVGAQPSRVEEQIFETVTAPDGLLRPHDEGYVFSHPLWEAYLASRHLATLPTEAVLERLDGPGWGAVIDFYAALGPMEAIIKSWLSQPDDLWYTRLRRTARWAAIAPPGAKWRNGIMALLARTLLTGDVPLPIRRRVADALIQTGDPGVVYFLRQAAGHTDAGVRVAALEALGQLAGEADLPTLEIALDDPETAVQQAAVAALGMMGGRAAVHRLTRLLLEADQELRVAAASALARCGGEGWDVLREGLEEEDLLTRRATVYGLSEIRQPWARELLVKTAREDREWIVRAAAEMATEARDATPRRVEAPIDVSEAGWLISWAAERDEVVSKGEAAFPILLRALEEGRPAIRRAAIGALALVGKPDHAAVLQRVMAEGDPHLASVALEALEELSRRHALPIYP